MNQFPIQTKWYVWGFTGGGRPGQFILPPTEKEILDGKKVLLNSMKKMAIAMLQTVLLDFLVWILFSYYFFIFFI